MNPEGIGMGLNICKKIVEKTGGSIECHSPGINKGSTFSFSMTMLEFEPPKEPAKDLPSTEFIA